MKPLLLALALSADAASIKVEAFALCSSFAMAISASEKNFNVQMKISKQTEINVGERPLDRDPTACAHLLALVILKIAAAARQDAVLDCKAASMQPVDNEQKVFFFVRLKNATRCEFCSIETTLVSFFLLIVSRLQTMIETASANSTTFVSHLRNRLKLLFIEFAPKTVANRILLMHFWKLLLQTDKQQNKIAQQRHLLMAEL